MPKYYKAKSAGLRPEKYRNKYSWISAICVPENELIKVLSDALPAVKIREYKLVDIFEDEF